MSVGASRLIYRENAHENIITRPINTPPQTWSKALDLLFFEPFNITRKSSCINGKGFSLFLEGDERENARVRGYTQGKQRFLFLEVGNVIFFFFLFFRGRVSGLNATFRWDLEMFFQRLEWRCVLGSRETKNLGVFMVMRALEIIQMAVVIKKGVDPWVFDEWLKNRLNRLTPFPKNEKKLRKNLN